MGLTRPRPTPWMKKMGEFSGAPFCTARIGSDATESHTCHKLVGQLWRAGIGLVLGAAAVGNSQSDYY